MDYRFEINEGFAYDYLYSKYTKCKIIKHEEIKEYEL